jgi:hypothetical protein
MNSLIVTLDIDWASETAIEQTLDFLTDRKIKPAVFVTHRSHCVEALIEEIDVGLHPYFGQDSSHGSTISEVVKTVMDFPHNFPAFRCHRFAVCNSSRQAMSEAGMLISSNVCTDLSIVSPFRDRFGMLEVPIFMEDGGYLWQKHSFEIDDSLLALLMQDGVKVITIHPMHFALNTPHFDYMFKIKQSVSRDEWHTMSKATLKSLRWPGRGIADFLVELLQLPLPTGRLRDLI